jgi:hypothetical protein
MEEDEEEEAWSVPDVYLLTEGPEGELAVPNLTLTILESGLALHKADGDPVWDSPWTALAEMSPVERSVLPDGRDGVVIMVVERGVRRRHRFVLASDDSESTEADIRGHAAAHGLRTRSVRPAVSRALMAVIVVAALAAITALLLSAVHVFHF